GGQTLQALGTYLYDDMLFINLARELMSGNWLGPYTETTLIKGPFYPMWVAMMSMLGAPLLIAQHVLYIASCMVFIVAIRPILKSPILLLAIYLILLFNPMSFTDGAATRVLRDGIYPALTILVMAGASGFLARVDRPLKVLVIWSATLGLAVSGFSLTREEGIWMVPAIVLVMGIAAFQIWGGGKRWQRLSLCLLPAVIWLTAVGTVSAINMHYYGAFRIVDIKAPGLLAAYGSLTRIQSEQWRPTIPVPEDVRERAYEVSPAFAELLPFLDEEKGLGWKGRDWRYQGRFSHWNWGDESIDIHGGNFFWALRDAVALAGHYTSVAEAEGFYQRLADEVNAACGDGRLVCGPERATVMPIWYSAYNGPLLSTLLRAAVYLVSFEDFKPEPFLSRAPQQKLELFAKTTHEHLFLAAMGQLNVRGWAFSPGKKLNISVVNQNGAPVEAYFRFGHSPHVYKRFLDRGIDMPKAREARFEMTTPCISGCYLDFTVDGRLIERLPLHASLGSKFTSGLYFGVDSVDPGTAGFSPSSAMMIEPKLKILSFIGRLYQLTMPLLFGLALIVYILHTIRVIRRRTLTVTWVLATALLGSVVARLLMVSIIDLISFPAIRTLYLASAYPLLLMFIIILLTESRQVLTKK
ncbi:MAG: hypothetical protein R8K46_09095, partial [Mariprofundaceae bacterium]